MIIQDITSFLENMAPLSLQEDYDNAGLLTGKAEWECTGVIISLDTTEAVVKEAIEKKCNLIVAHHPIIFKGLKKINGKNYVEEAIITAIKNDIAIYAIHTNLDNVIHGVNAKIADKLSLVNRKILLPKNNLLKKLAVFVPVTQQQKLLDALFAAGAGNIGHYSECSFSTAGDGTFKAGEDTSPYVGEKGQRHTESEVKVEVIFPHWLQGQIIKAMQANHPYEEVAYDIYSLVNSYQETGSGIVGELEAEMTEAGLLAKLQQVFAIPCIKHTTFTGRMVKRIAVCGGAGSFLTGTAIASKADVYVTSDIKYHEFFDAEGRLLLADIGHWESEQYTISLLSEVLRQKFLNFAVLKTEIETNPVRYFTGR